MMRRKIVALVALLAGSVLLSGCEFDVYKLPLPGGADTGDNPMTAVNAFLESHDDFERDAWGRRALVTEFRDGILRRR